MVRFLSYFALAALLLSSAASSAATEKLIHQFNDVPHGSWSSGVVADTAGNLYGVTVYGGAYRCGLVLKLAPNSHGGWNQTIVYNFTGGADGGNPEGPLTIDAAGNLYGTTSFGGTFNDGTVFQLTPNARGIWDETVLHNFASGNDGIRPFNRLTVDASGNIYGTTFDGGASGQGIAFELTLSSGVWTENILHTFTGGSDGGNPISLVLDKSGNLFGSAEQGGVLRNGLIFELSPATGSTWTYNAVYQFLGVPDGALPGSMVFDDAGNLFGTTLIGGTSKCNNPNQGCGTTFELKQVGSQWQETTLYSFSSSEQGGNTTSPSISGFDAAGNLYGETVQGGSGFCENGCGSVFKLSPSHAGGWTETTLYSFTAGSDGYSPGGGVVVGSRGQLYGATFGGANELNGTVFALSPASPEWKLTTLYDFPYADGAVPFTSLTADGLGNFYGTTSYGGSHDLGTVFKLTPAGGGKWKETLVYSFPVGDYTGENGVSPSSVILDSAGNLYGVTSFGGAFFYGTVFELSPGAGGKWTEKDIFDFSSQTYPMGNLVMDKAGNLYGTTNQGDEQGLGTVFELSPGKGGKWNEKTIYNFQGYPSDGSNPQAAMIFDSAGNLYGTTEKGGSSANCKDVHKGCGTVFKLSYASGVWTESILYSFSGSTSDGAYPLGSLISDAAGNLYGTTSAGGIDGNCPGAGNLMTCGTVFELSPGSGGAWSEKLLYEFTKSAGDGGAPVAALTFDHAGNLYGTTSQGNVCGVSGCGTVFELSPASGSQWTETVLYDFAGDLDGWNPRASLVFDSAGNLYSTTAGGGKAGVGTVFEIIP